MIKNKYRQVIAGALTALAMVGAVNISINPMIEAFAKEDETKTVVGRIFDPQSDLIKQDILEVCSSISEKAKRKFEHLGRFKLTAYCPCRECSEHWGTQTSTGKVATEGRTIAVDPEVIPYGSKVKINGETYIAEDCGSAIKGKEIDIYFNTHEEVDNFGVKYADIEKIN